MSGSNIVEKLSDRGAAMQLAEGDVSEAIEILEGEGDVGPWLRATLSSMLRGEGPDGTKLSIEHTTGGRPKRRHRNFKRDTGLAFAVKQKLTDNPRMSKTQASRFVADQAGCKVSTVTNAYRDYLNDFDFISQLMADPESSSSSVERMRALVKRLGYDQPPWNRKLPRS